MVRRVRNIARDPRMGSSRSSQTPVEEQGRSSEPEWDVCRGSWTIEVGA